MRITPSAFGFDASSTVPNANAQVPSGTTKLIKVLGMLAWLSQHTNLTIAGGYQNGNFPDWHEVFLEAWTRGWGLVIFDSELRTDGQPTMVMKNGKKAPRPHAIGTRQDGELDAQSVVGRADTVAGRLSRAVRYVDNEDNDVRPPTFPNILDYYVGLFRWLETQPPSVVHMRPGIYGHEHILKPLLAQFPYLYVITPEYDKDDLDINVSVTISRARASFHSSNRTAIPWAGKDDNLVTTHVPGTGPTRDWRVWPVGSQWKGTDSTALVVTPPPASVTWELGSHFPIGFNSTTWSVDYESSLVDDPAYPSVSPRLALSPQGNLAQLTRLHLNDQLEGRSGYLEAGRLLPTGEAVFREPQASKYAWGKYLPDCKPCWMSGDKKTLLVAQRRLDVAATLETHLLSNGSLRAWSPNIYQGTAEMFVHDRWAVAACSDTLATLFVASAGGQGSANVGAGGDLSYAAAAPDAASWPQPNLVGRELVHTYSNICATARSGQSVNAFFIDANRTLHTAYHTSQGSGHFPIGKTVGRQQAPELLPTTHLAACSPAPDTLVVAAVGYDLRLHIASWTSKGQPRWQGPYPIGTDDQLLCAHTDLAIAWNRWTRRVEVLATTNDLKICLYELQEDQSTLTWQFASSSNKRRMAFDNPSDLVFAATLPYAIWGANMRPFEVEPVPNPFGDLIIGYANDQRIIGAVFNSFAVSGPVVATAQSSAVRSASNPLRWVALPSSLGAQRAEATARLYPQSPYPPD